MQEVVLTEQEKTTLSEREQEALLKVRQEVAEEAKKKEEEAIAKAKQAEEDALLRVPLIEKATERYLDRIKANNATKEKAIAKAIKDGCIEGKDFTVTRTTDTSTVVVWVGSRGKREGHDRYGAEEVKIGLERIKISIPYKYCYSKDIFNPKGLEVDSYTVGVEWCKVKRSYWDNDHRPDELNGRCKQSSIMGDYKQYSLSSIIQEGKRRIARVDREVETFLEQAANMKQLIDKLKSDNPKIKVGSSYKRGGAVRIKYPSGSEIHLRASGTVLEYESAIPTDESLESLHSLFSAQPKRKKNG